MQTPSIEGAEDALQEALLAAWQGLGGFQERAQIRTWLYRVVTTRCLNARRSARRRRGVLELPGPQPPQATRLGEVTWLEPYPEDLLEGLADAGPGPEASYQAHEAISLAFIIAVQLLPPRQSAVLILYQGRDLIARFLTAISFRDGRTYRLIPTRANGQLAFGAYLREARPDAAQANSLLVLTLTGSRIQAMTRFEGTMLPRFGLPPG